MSDKDDELRTWLDSDRSKMVLGIPVVIFAVYFLWRVLHGLWGVFF